MTKTAEKPFMYPLGAAHAYIAHIREYPHPPGFTTWLAETLVPLDPIRRKTNSNYNLLAHIFPWLITATCIFFEFWVVHWIVKVLWDWSEWFFRPRSHLSAVDSFETVTFSFWIHKFPHPRVIGFIVDLLFSTLESGFEDIWICLKRVDGSRTWKGKVADSKRPR